jgi:hypothetical protein
VGRTPKRSGRAPTLRAVDCEGPGGATECCESTVASSVVSEPRIVCAFQAEEEEEDTLIHTTCIKCGIRAG